jgi:hypothetical protein
LEHVKHCCLQVSPFSFTSKNLERKGYFKKMLEEIGGASVWPPQNRPTPCIRPNSISTFLFFHHLACTVMKVNIIDADASVTTTVNSGAHDELLKITVA